MWIGVISNTEGYVSPELPAALHGVDYIVHCGGDRILGGRRGTLEDRAGHGRGRAER